ncbi:MAG: hypothetical protein MZU91_01875 [Desulfosudis oleivorans]|nr:hypothetical protein [Desulfosudis oleivorans]
MIGKNKQGARLCPFTRNGRKAADGDPEEYWHLLPAGVLFLYLLPLAIARGGASLDRWLGLHSLDLGMINRHPRRTIDGHGVLLRPLVDL